MTTHCSDAARTRSFGVTALVAIAAIAVVALCVTGIAAFIGALPQSDSVACATTATPIIDIQVERAGDLR